MCSGIAVLYKIPRIVVGENVTFQGPERHLVELGVELAIANNEECISLMQAFIKNHPELRNEDIGE